MVRLNGPMACKIKKIAVAAGLSLATLGAASAESVVTVAMTAADIPDWAGQPDQGFEGTRFVGYSLYEGLVSWDLSSSDKEVDIIPGLATAWNVDPENPRRWLFDLRTDAAFHDGCAWNADAAEWNISRLIDEAHPAFSPVQFARARSRTSAIEGVEKVDEDTIAITTKTVESLFPYNLVYVLMLSKCAVEAAGNDFAVYAEAPAGSGPYKFGSVVPHERLELVKNEDYWNQARIPKHDKLVLLPMPEATTRAAALLSGQVNFVEAPSPDMIPALEGAGMQIITNAYPHTWPYILNNLTAPFNDVRVRQAINYAVNRDDMVAMLGGIAAISYGPYTKSQANYGEAFEYPHDPAKATALLQEAGCYPCTITVAISPSGSGQMQPLPMNELVKAQLEQAGFVVNFEVIDWNTMITVYSSGAVAYPQYNAVNFSSAVMEPLTFVKNFMRKYQTPNGSNWGGYYNEQVEALLEETITSFDADHRNDLLRQAHKIVTEDGARLTVVSDLNPRALAPNLSGFVQAQSWFQDMTPIVVNE
ncbi:MAG: transporter substrate-binding protein [Devosia sp.]|nr:transporter substrate-binding protein [Devosia sp.]